MSEVLDRPITEGKNFQFPAVSLHTENNLLFFYYYHDLEHIAIVVDQKGEVPKAFKLTRVWVFTKKKSIDRGSYMQIIGKSKEGEYLVAEVYPNKGTTNNNPKPSRGRKPSNKGTTRGKKNVKG